MKTIIFVILIVMSSCVTVKNGKTSVLSLTKAVKQGYTLGIQMNNGKSSGVIYSMYFANKKPIEVNKVWINGVNVDFEKVATSIPEKSFRIQSTFYHKNKSNIHKDIKLPMEIEGEGLIEYTIDGETKYYIIPVFERLKKGPIAR